MPLAGIENLRRVRLGGEIGCDVERLRTARPDLIVEYTPLAVGSERLFEKWARSPFIAPGEASRSGQYLTPRI
jgi:hypothetical protein